MKNNSKIPELRFKGFTNNWVQIKLGDIYSFKNGLNKEKDFFGKGTPIVNYMDVNKNTHLKGIDIKGRVKLSKSEIERYSANKGDVFFTRTSETSEEIGLASVLLEEIPNAVFSGFILRARPKKNFILPEFSSYCFSTYKVRKEIIRKSSITTRALTSGKALKDVLCWIPEQDEQKKIADLIMYIDQKILNQQQQIEILKNLKKGYMERIFSQKIRFKDDHGDEFPEWQEKKLSSITNRITRKNKSNESDLPLTISAIHGLIDQETYFNKKVASKNMSNYYLLYNGEFAYNKSYSVGYPFGAIKRLDKYEKGALSSLYICFKPKQILDSDFLVYYFESTSWHKEIYKIAVEGARNHGLLNISISDFFNTRHKIPVLKEQQKIADFLSTLDKKIEVEKEILQYWKQIKKGLLQKMFV